MTETTTRVMLTLIPILAPSLKPVDFGVEVGVVVGAMASGACAVLEAATARSVEDLDVLVACDVVTAARDLDEVILDVVEVEDRVGFADDDVSEDDDVVTLAGVDVFDATNELVLRLMVVKGLLKSKLFTTGSAWHGRFRSCWQQKELFVSERVMPRPRSMRTR